MENAGFNEVFYLLVPHLGYVAMGALIPVAIDFVARLIFGASPRASSPILALIVMVLGIFVIAWYRSDDPGGMTYINATAVSVGLAIYLFFIERFTAGRRT